MLDHLKQRLTFANLMSTIAVFIALGGSALALGRNSVGTKQLKKNAVTTSKIHDNAVTGAKINLSTVQLPPPGCPAGTTKALGACIETHERAAATYQSAVDNCAASGRVLPSAQQLIGFTRDVSGIPATERSGDFVTDPSTSIDVAPGGGRSAGTVSSLTPYRCVSTPGG
jgi:hypothetical protein